MTLTVSAEPVPIKADKNGVLKIGKTRVTLDTVVTVFLNGATPEEIVQQYPVLELADVYHVISYFLRHQDEVMNYLEKEHALAEETHQKMLMLFNPTGIRERLLARKKITF
jgi:uncharacterized protein (DUF433 family)